MNSRSALHNVTCSTIRAKCQSSLHLDSHRWLNKSTYSATAISTSPTDPQPPLGRMAGLRMQEYHESGFSATAVTAIGVRATGLRSYEERTVRVVEVTFDHPHAVVAGARRGAGGRAVVQRVGDSLSRGRCATPGPGTSVPAQLRRSPPLGRRPPRGTGRHEGALGVRAGRGRIEVRRPCPGALGSTGPQPGRFRTAPAWSAAQSPVRVRSPRGRTRTHPSRDARRRPHPTGRPLVR